MGGSSRHSRSRSSSRSYRSRSRSSYTSRSRSPSRERRGSRHHDSRSPSPKRRESRHEFRRDRSGGRASRRADSRDRDRGSDWSPRARRSRSRSARRGSRRGDSRDRDRNRDSRGDRDRAFHDREDDRDRRRRNSRPDSERRGSAYTGRGDGNAEARHRGGDSRRSSKDRRERRDYESSPSPVRETRDHDSMDEGRHPKHSNGSVRVTEKGDHKRKIDDGESKLDAGGRKYSTAENAAGVSSKSRGGKAKADDVSQSSKRRVDERDGGSTHRKVSRDDRSASRSESPNESSKNPPITERARASVSMGERREDKSESSKKGKPRDDGYDSRSDPLNKSSKPKGAPITDRVRTSISTGERRGDGSNSPAHLPRKSSKSAPVVRASMPASERKEESRVVSADEGADDSEEQFSDDNTKGKLSSTLKVVPADDDGGSKKAAKKRSRDGDSISSQKPSVAGGGKEANSAGDQSGGGVSGTKGSSSEKSRSSTQGPLKIKKKVAKVAEKVDAAKEEDVVSASKAAEDKKVQQFDVPKEKTKKKKKPSGKVASSGQDSVVAADDSKAGDKDAGVDARPQKRVKVSAGGATKTAKSSEGDADVDTSSTEKQRKKSSSLAAGTVKTGEGDAVVDSVVDSSTERVSSKAKTARGREKDALEGANTEKHSATSPPKESSEVPLLAEDSQVDSAAQADVAVTPKESKSGSRAPRSSGSGSSGKKRPSVLEEQKASPDVASDMKKDANTDKDPKAKSGAVLQKGGKGEKSGKTKRKESVAGEAKDLEKSQKGEVEEKSEKMMPKEHVSEDVKDFDKPQQTAKGEKSGKSKRKDSASTVAKDVVDDPKEAERGEKIVKIKRKSQKVDVDKAEKSEKSKGKESVSVEMEDLNKSLVKDSASSNREGAASSMEATERSKPEGAMLVSKEKLDEPRVDAPAAEQSVEAAQETQAAAPSDKDADGDVEMELSTGEDLVGDNALVDLPSNVPLVESEVSLSTDQGRLPPPAPRRAAPLPAPAVVLETKMDSTYRKKCKDLIGKLQKKDSEWENVFAVDLNASPPVTYLQIVQDPICLPQIKTKLPSYGTLEQFLRDVRRMLANCASFNVSEGFDDAEGSLRLWALEFVKIVEAKVDPPYRIMQEWEECMIVMDQVLTALHSQTPLKNGSEKILVGLEFFTRPCPPLQQFDAAPVDKYIRQVSSTVNHTMDLTKLTHLLLQGDIKTPREFGRKLLQIPKNCQKAEAQRLFKGYSDTEKYAKRIKEGCTLFQQAATKALEEHFPNVDFAARSSASRSPTPPPMHIAVPPIRLPVSSAASTSAASTSAAVSVSASKEPVSDVVAFAIRPRTIVASDVPLSEFAKVNNELHYFVAALSTRRKGKTALAGFIKEAVEKCNALLTSITDKVKEAYAKKNAVYDGFLYKPVNVDIIPDWHQVINDSDSTACLEKVEKSLGRFKHANMEVFRSEVLEVLDNSIKYNSPGSGKWGTHPVLEMVKSLRESFQKELDESVRDLQKKYNACQQILADTAVTPRPAAGSATPTSGAGSSAVPLMAHAVPPPLPVVKSSMLSSSKSSSKVKPLAEVRPLADVRPLAEVMPVAPPTVAPSPLKVSVKLPKETTARLSTSKMSASASKSSVSSSSSVTKSAPAAASVVETVPEPVAESPKKLVAAAEDEVVAESPSPRAIKVKEVKVSTPRIKIKTPVATSASPATAAAARISVSAPPVPKFEEEPEEVLPEVVMQIPDALLPADFSTDHDLYALMKQHMGEADAELAATSAGHTIPPPPMQLLKKKGKKRERVVEMPLQEPVVNKARKLAASSTAGGSSAAASALAEAAASVVVPAPPGSSEKRAFTISVKAKAPKPPKPPSPSQSDEEGEPGAIAEQSAPKKPQKDKKPTKKRKASSAEGARSAVASSGVVATFSPEKMVSESPERGKHPVTTVEPATLGGTKVRIVLSGKTKKVATTGIGKTLTSGVGYMVEKQKQFTAMYLFEKKGRDGGPLEWEEEAKKILNQLLTHDLLTKGLLRLEQPVARMYPNVAEAYLDAIEEPMDLGSLGEMLVKGRVRDPERFAKLLLLVFNNAIQFNHLPETEAELKEVDVFTKTVVETCKHLRTIARWLCLEYLPVRESAPEEMQEPLSEPEELAREDTLELTEAEKSRQRKRRELLINDVVIEGGAEGRKDAKKMMTALKTEKTKLKAFVPKVQVDFLLNYSKIVTRPISVSEMEEKLKDDEYVNHKEYLDDWRRIFSNALLYNRPNMAGDRSGQSRMVVEAAEYMIPVLEQYIGKQYTIDILERIGTARVYAKEGAWKVEEWQRTAAQRKAEAEAQRLREPQTTSTYVEDVKPTPQIENLMPEEEIHREISNPDFEAHEETAAQKRRAIEAERENMRRVERARLQQEAEAARKKISDELITLCMDHISKLQPHSPPGQTPSPSPQRQIQAPQTPPFSPSAFLAPESPNDDMDTSLDNDLIDISQASTQVQLTSTWQTVDAKQSISQVLSMPKVSLAWGKADRRRQKRQQHRDLQSSAVFDTQLIYEPEEPPPPIVVKPAPAPAPTPAPVPPTPALPPMPSVRVTRQRSHRSLSNASEISVPEASVPETRQRSHRSMSSEISVPEASVPETRQRSQRSLSTEISVPEASVPETRQRSHRSLSSVTEVPEVEVVEKVAVEPELAVIANQTILSSDTYVGLPLPNGGLEVTSIKVHYSSTSRGGPISLFAGPGGELVFMDAGVSLKVTPSSENAANRASGIDANDDEWRLSRVPAMAEALLRAAESPEFLLTHPNPGLVASSAAQMERCGIAGASSACTFRSLPCLGGVLASATRQTYGAVLRIVAPPGRVTASSLNATKVPQPTVETVIDEHNTHACGACFGHTIEIDAYDGIVGVNGIVVPDSVSCDSTFPTQRLRGGLRSQLL